MDIKKKIEAKCIDFDEKGQGVFYLGKNKYSCPNFLPRETGLLEENIYQGIKKYRLVKLLKESNLRIVPPCKIYNRCGGCQLLHIPYDKQIEFKVNYVQNALKENNIPNRIDEIIKSDKQYEYRNKMQVCYRYYNKDLVYGFYEELTHRIIPNDYCVVQSAKQNEIAKSICKVMKELRISPYDEDKRTGIIRFAIIREAIKTKEFLVTIVTNGNVFPGKNEFVKRLMKLCPYISTIVQNINTRKTSIILGDTEQVMYGKGYIIDELCDVRFKISSSTFFQVNPYQTEKLYNKVVEYLALQGSETVIDAYCGVGTIGMIVSKKAKFVIGVESNKQSVINARLNASDNGINNIKFINKDATDYLVEEASNNTSIDALIMDPPRSGSTEKFLNSILKLKPNKIVYVSCEATTLSRDLKLLVNDYKIIKKGIVDMFVGTYHIETIVLLEKIIKVKSSGYRNKYMTGEDIDMLQERKKSNYKSNVCDNHWDGA